MSAKGQASQPGCAHILRRRERQSRGLVVVLSCQQFRSKHQEGTKGRDYGLATARRSLRFLVPTRSKHANPPQEGRPQKSARLITAARNQNPKTDCSVLPLQARPRSTGARHAADHPATRNLQGTRHSSACFGSHGRRDTPGLVLHVVPAPPRSGRPPGLRVWRGILPAAYRRNTNNGVAFDMLPPSTFLGTTAARCGAWEDTLDGRT